MLQVLINSNDATRSVTSGGSNLVKTFLNIVTPSVLNQRYIFSTWVKNNGPNDLVVQLTGIGNSTVVKPGNFTFVKLTALGDGVSNVQLAFASTVIANSIDYTAWNPILCRSNFLTENLIPIASRDFDHGWSSSGGSLINVTLNSLRTIDYTKYIEPGSLTITDQLNQPMTCNFSLTNIDDIFVPPLLESYVQVYSNQYNRYVFTGFISVDYQRDYIGMNGKTPSTNFQQYRYAITCTGDEYLLAAKAVPFLPPFVNEGAGNILARLANIVAPGFFDVTSKCLSGDLIPYQEYDPNKNWTSMAKTFADQFRYRVRILNKVLYYQPYGDQSFPIKYDDTLHERTFDPQGLKTSIYNTTLANDAIIIGDIEASDNHEDYFIGDGFTSNFPLRYTVFDGDTAHLVSQDWTQGSIDTSKWFEQDPTNAITSFGALNVNGGTNHFGETYLYMRTGLDFGRKIVLNHGEVFFVGNCSGAIIGGVYDNANTFAEVSGSGQCECGFDIRPAAGFTVSVSVSGTSGLQIQPRRLGQLLGTPIITQQNHYYLLRTIINGKSVNRYTTTFKSLTGAIVQGGTNTATADITWVVTDIDLNNTNPNMPGFVNTQPPFKDTRFTLQNAVMPAFGIYVPINVSNANFTLQWTDIFDPPQGSLSAAGLSGVSGGQLPLLPGNVGPIYDYELGFGIGRQVATLGNASNVSTGGAASDGTGSELQFYSDSIPGVGSRIKIQAWEAQASVARVQDTVSIAKEAAVVGDDGHRVAIMTDFKPLPRSSEECELAGKAALMDRTTTIYQGSYSVEDTFFDFKNNDYPRTGEFFVINSPQRNLVNFSAVCSSVTIKYIELWTERSAVTVNFGPTSFLQNLLAMFVPKPNNTLLPQNTAKPPTPIQLANIGSAFCADLSSLTLTGGPTPSLGFDSSNIYGDVGLNLSGNQFVEVRQTNFGWGLANNDRLAIINTRLFTLPRTRFDGSWYFRMLQGSFDGAGNLITGGLISRRSKVLRIYAPIVPASPQVLYADSSTIKAFYNGDIRNIYGIELRGPDNATVLAQKPVSTPTDMELDLVKLQAGQFWVSPNLLLSTEELDGPQWNLFGNASVSGNATLDPSGLAINADQLVLPGKLVNTLDGIQQIVNLPSLYFQDQTTIAGTTFTFSTWLRTSGGTAQVELVIEDSPFTVSPAFGTKTVTSSWQRFSVTGTFPSGSGKSVAVWIRSPFASAIGAQSIFVADSQLEIGSSASNYSTNVNNYGPRNLVQATEELDNINFWTASTPSVTGGYIQYTVPFTKQGIVTSGTIFTASNCLDDAGNCLDSVQLGSSVNIAGVAFVFGTPNTNNVMACNGQQLPIPPDYYSSIRLIGSGQGFIQSVSGSFIANYSDGTSQVFTQLFTQWAVAGVLQPNETTAKLMTAADSKDGTQFPISVRQFHYQFNLDSTKRLINITCPSNRGIVILAINLIPQSYQTTVTPSTTLDPMGNLTADQINLAPKGTNADSGLQQIVNTPLAKSKTFTFSIWLKTSGANISAELVVQDTPFTKSIIDQVVTVTNQWQRFIFTGSFGLSANNNIRIYIGSRFTIAVGAQVLYAWGAQLEYADTATTYLGNGNVLTPFYLYFFNIMWAYSLVNIVQISSPQAPILTLGSKLANSVEFRLDRLNRGDIRQTTLQLSTDGSFLTASNISVTGSGQPASFAMNVASVALSAFFVRSRRKSYFNDGAWSTPVFVPYGTIIASTWAGGQGSIPPALDNQSTALFTATTSALAGGGANTGRIVITWPQFTITYPDQTPQVVITQSFDTGTTLTSTVGVTTPYIFYPRLRAQIAGSIPEFVNGAHSSQTVADAQICQADGYLPLGGSALSIIFNVPAANAVGGGTSSGGGTGGGSKCLPEDEIITVQSGEKIALETMMIDMILGADPNTKELHWNTIDKLGYGEAICVEIECEDGSKGKCSIDTELPIWTDENTYSYIKPLRIKGRPFMLSKKNGIHLTRIKLIRNIGMCKIVKMTVGPWHTIFSRDLLTHNGVLPKQ